jgi:UDP-glucose 4-epimerase
VVDLADAHIKALRALEQNKEGFICNLGTGTGSSVLDVIDAFEKANGIRIPYEFASRRSGDVTEAWADPTYAKKKLGWESNHDLVDMLRDAWNWQSKNPNGYK